MSTPSATRLSRARDQLPHTLDRCVAPEPDLRGKVRDIYHRGDELLLVASDRVSAFDVVLGTIPFKGAALTEQAAFWLQQAESVITTHLIERFDPQAMRVRRATPLALEVVVRGYLAGSLMREPAPTRGQAYGLRIDPAVAPYQAFASPVITPTTKAASGEHDQPCSMEQLIAAGTVSRAQAQEIEEAALALFAMGSEFAAKQGLLLVDTKYEFGLLHDRIILIDEIHTADSSRYWRQSSYTERVCAGEPPDMLDKERLRRWLLARGFSGTGAPPTLSEEIRLELSTHYWELTELLLGRDFDPPCGDVGMRVEKALARFSA